MTSSERPEQTCCALAGAGQKHQASASRSAAKLAFAGMANAGIIVILLPIPWLWRTLRARRQPDGRHDIPPRKCACRRYRDRKSVVSGKSGSVRVDLGGRRILKKKKTK